MFRSYWPVFVCSFVVSLVATPLCRWIALRRRIVDQPDEFLKPHARPVPYLGGVAIYLGWAAGIGLAFVLFDQAAEETEAPRLGPTLDLAMVGEAGSGLQVLTNSGDAVFDKATGYVVGSGAFHVTAADLDSDGFPELITSNQEANTLRSSPTRCRAVTSMRPRRRSSS